MCIICRQYSLLAKCITLSWIALGLDIGTTPQKIVDGRFSNPLPDSDSPEKLHEASFMDFNLDDVN